MLWPILPLFYPIVVLKYKIKKQNLDFKRILSLAYTVYTMQRLKIHGGHSGKRQWEAALDMRLFAPSPPSCLSSAKNKPASIEIITKKNKLIPFDVCVHLEWNALYY